MPQTQPGPIQRVLVVNGLDHLILMCPIRGNGYRRRRKFTRVRVMSRRRPRMEADWTDLPGRSWRLTDILGQSMFERDGGELAGPGLFVDPGPWQFHLLALQ
jgi:hypothetical protein